MMFPWFTSKIENIDRLHIQMTQSLSAFDSARFDVVYFRSRCKWAIIKNRLAEITETEMFVKEIKYKVCAGRGMFRTVFDLPTANRSHQMPCTAWFR